MIKIVANGKVHLAIFDAKAEEYQDNDINMCMDSCPECGASITEEINYCEDCECHIIWQNSKTWRRLYGSTSKQAIENIERSFASDLESVALEVLQSTVYGVRLGSLTSDELILVWPAGVMKNLRILRSIEKMPSPKTVRSKDFLLHMKRTCTNAVNKYGEFNSASANYLLYMLINKLGAKGKIASKGQHIRSRQGIVDVNTNEDETIVGKGTIV